MDTRDVIQLVEFLANLHKALGWIPYVPVIPVLEGGGDQKFEVTLRYVTSLGYRRPCVKGRDGEREKGRERRNDRGGRQLRNWGRDVAQYQNAFLTYTRTLVQPSTTQNKNGKRHWILSIPVAPLQGPSRTAPQQSLVMPWDSKSLSRSGEPWFTWFTSLSKRKPSLPVRRWEDSHLQTAIWTQWAWSSPISLPFLTWESVSSLHISSRCCQLGLWNRETNSPKSCSKPSDNYISALALALSSRGMGKRATQC